MTDEVFRELVIGVIISIDLLGIDVKKEFPKLWEYHLKFSKKL